MFNVKKKTALCALGILASIGAFSVTAFAAPTTNRLAGQSRVQTAVSIANAGWTQSDYAIIAYAWDFPDAVSAAPLSYKDNAPILLTDKDTLSADTEKELDTLQVKHIIIVGGTGVVSSKVESVLKAKGMDVQRISGKNRFETSVAIADAVGTSSEIVVTNGYSFGEALSISPIAAKKGMPIILTDKNDIPDAVKNYLSKNQISKTYVLGNNKGTVDSDGISDTIVASYPNAVRIAGDDVYERNINIINMFKNDIDFSKVYLATGKDFADALTGSALASKTSSPIIFVDNKISKVTKEFIASEYASVKEMDVLGGTGTVADNTLQALTAEPKTNNQNHEANALKEKLDSLVTSGKITQDQETAALNLFTQNDDSNKTSGSKPSDIKTIIKTKLDSMVTVGTITADQETMILNLFTQDVNRTKNFNNKDTNSVNNNNEQQSN